MKKILGLLKKFTKFEIFLWVFSLITVTISFMFLQDKNYLTLIASLIGVTALIFIAKGFVLGQVLCVIFAVFYGIISFATAYYGEMITYLGMSAPIAVLSVISWIKNPYKNSDEVKVAKLSKKQIICILVLAIVVTVAFYFLLKFLGNANLILSTISVTTSFVAAYLTFLRSPLYGIGYAANDVVLIILWVLATIENISYFPMIICFAVFLINDVYGFINWQKIKLEQQNNQ